MYTVRDSDNVRKKNKKRPSGLYLDVHIQIFRYKNSYLHFIIIFQQTRIDNV